MLGHSTSSSVAQVHPRRSAWRITLTALITIVIAAAYIVGDIFGLVPGVLTNSSFSHYSAPQTRTAYAAATLDGKLESGTPINSKQASDLVNTLKNAEGVGSDISAVIRDSSGSTIAQLNATTAREPASTLKTLTAFAAASTLDMGSTLDTKVYLVQPKGGTPQLILQGSGDMLLGAGQNDTAHVNGRAGLATLASRTMQALHQRGISQVTLKYDDSLFGSERMPAGIQQNDAEWRYFTPISSMAVDGGKQWSGTAKPSNPDNDEVYPTRSTTTAADTAKTFISSLSSAGIKVDGAATSGDAPANSSPIASVSSAKLSEIMAYMLRNSDNTEAELFGRLLALKLDQANSTAGATAATQSVLKKDAIDTSGLHMADSSGLSPGSMVTVNTLTDVQEKLLVRGSAVAEADGLSVVGVVGTAKSRSADDSMNGLVRVKTGTLSTVSAMAGNVSRIHGGALTFAVIINNGDNMWSAEQAVNAFVAALPKL
ncbi:D-alanyl-D-alanine carboxypeptidase [Bifidobacterium aquikefiri]|uniref:D-alanyl-D-alanine carboxypeptidase n=1 Tax=Bifidobacterium aquikefiri TaxID=1653207 RepID=A0A261G6X6_9BIFI|nr:D-alanyl-D-alanine carboxypeptidase [Bifidobacterium aquikefiri]